MVHHPRPGRYVLTLHVKLPHIAWHSTTQGNLFTQDSAFPLTVTPADAGRLRAVAEGLRRSVAQDDPLGSGRLPRPTSLAALFSMPASSVADIWRAVVGDGRAAPADWRYLPMVAHALGQVPSPAAADLLADMRWGAPQQPGGAPPADGMSGPGHGDELEELYNAADPTLKQHIRQIYAAHGISVGEVIHLPANG